MWALWIELRSSSTQGKHFANWNISSATHNFFTILVICLTFLEIWEKSHNALQTELPKMHQDFNVTINKTCLPMGDMGLWIQDPDFRADENCLIFIYMVIRQMFLERNPEYPHIKQDLFIPDVSYSRVIQTTSSMLVTGFVSPGPPGLSMCHVASKEKGSSGHGTTRIGLCLPRSKCSQTKGRSWQPSLNRGPENLGAGAMEDVSEKSRHRC